MLYIGDNIFAEYDGNDKLLVKYTQSPLPDDDQVLGFNNPKAVVTTNGNLIIADSGNNVVRSFDFASRRSNVIAGNGYNVKHRQTTQKFMILKLSL